MRCGAVETAVWKGGRLNVLVTKGGSETRSVGATTSASFPARAGPRMSRWRRAGRALEASVQTRAPTLTLFPFPSTPHIHISNPSVPHLNPSSFPVSPSLSPFHQIPVTPRPLHPT